MLTNGTTTKALELRATDNGSITGFGCRGDESYTTSRVLIGPSSTFNPNGASNRLSTSFGEPGAGSAVTVISGRTRSLLYTTFKPVSCSSRSACSSVFPEYD